MGITGGDLGFVNQQPAERNAERTDRLVLKSGGRLWFVSVNDIEWIEAAANYVQYHVAGTTYPVRATIGSVLDRLDQRRFLRVHRSFIINVDKVVELEPCGNGEYIVRMKSGKRLPSGRAYRRCVNSLFQ